MNNNNPKPKNYGVPTYSYYNGSYDLKLRKENNNN